MERDCTRQATNPLSYLRDIETCEPQSEKWSRKSVEGEPPSRFEACSLSCRARRPFLNVHCLARLHPDASSAGRHREADVVAEKPIKRVGKRRSSLSIFVLGPAQVSL